MIKFSTFDHIFQAATGHPPFPYQRVLATLDAPPALLHVPTGSGKTQAVLMAWLWWRRHAEQPGVRQRTPRRLVYVLPMRALVEQTERVANSIMARLPIDQRVQVYTLLGGDVDDDWLRYPEQAAVLIGTQDMLLSRALNRGYAQSRFAWPRAFGLLNNDAYWVLDEVQLMGSGLATTTQLAGLRSALGTAAPVWSTWMSATAEPTWLGTVDHSEPGREAVLELSDADRGGGEAATANPLARRLHAAKTLHFSGVTVSGMKSATDVAQAVLAAHRSGSLTLAIVNTVARARQVYQELQRRGDQGTKGRGSGRRALQTPSETAPDLLLLHSRFRPLDRITALDRLLDAAREPQGAGMIAVATQVVEAGVDVSARTLVTELAPWASLVQRLGRLNRTGDFVDATAYWVDLLDGDKGLAAPYSLEELAAARKQLHALEGASVSPQALEAQTSALPYQPAHVLRRRDLLGLFDTTADLTEVDLDVSPYVRDIDDRDAQVFWRDWPHGGEMLTAPTEELEQEGGPEPGEDEEGGATAGASRPARHSPPPSTMDGPTRDELCSVPIGEARAVLKAGVQAFRWDAVDGGWLAVRPDELRPGMELVLHTAVGRYTADSGWDPDSTKPMQPLGGAGSKPETMASDYSNEHWWQTLVEHTDGVVRAMEEIVGDLDLPPYLVRVLRRSARLHDLGKAHPSWQERLRDKGGASRPAQYEGRIMAKAPVVNWRRGRRYLRHELVSALALLADPSPLNDLDDRDADLVRYLIASHHGRVRLAIRSLAGEVPPIEGPVRRGDDHATPDPSGAMAPRQPARALPPHLYALGILAGDELGRIDLGAGETIEPLTLSLDAMLLGERGGSSSWVERVRRLRDAEEVGPFRLAYYEALLRAADGRADEARATEAHQEESHG